MRGRRAKRRRRHASAKKIPGNGPGRSTYLGDCFAYLADEQPWRAWHRKNVCRADSDRKLAMRQHESKFRQGRLCFRSPCPLTHPHHHRRGVKPTWHRGTSEAAAQRVARNAAWPRGCPLGTSGGGLPMPFVPKQVDWNGYPVRTAPARKTASASGTSGLSGPCATGASGCRSWPAPFQAASSPPAVDCSPAGTRASSTGSKSSSAPMTASARTTAACSRSVRPFPQIRDQPRVSG